MSGGEFWTVEDPERHVRGVFTAEVGRKAEATLEAGLTTGLSNGPMPAPAPAFKPGDMAGAMTAHAASSVARFRAISFQGQLDTGELVSMLEARNYGGMLGDPRYEAAIAVFGAHVLLDQLYTTVRFASIIRIGSVI